MKAGLRILMKYYYTNIRRFMFIGTTNKTEYYLDLYTKYGDGGVDFLPLADR